MTTAPARPVTRAATSPRHRPALGFEGAVVLVSLVLRAPYLAAPAGSDEAGFLQVARQWSAGGGGSLYGHYWVDRPPLLIGIYQLAASTGGIVALRVIGCVAVGVTILACARVAGTVGGPRASRWTALLAAALLVAPQLSAEEVDGELLAAPLIALGILALVGATRAPDRRAATWRAAAGGAAGTAALLVKQNMADVLVLGLVLALASRASAYDGPLDLARLAGAFAAGAAAVTVTVGAWTVLHGTSLAGVVQAMYAFRAQAAHVIATEGGRPYAQARGLALARMWVTSGLALLTLAVVAGGRRWAREPVMLALVATTAFDLVSIALGGGYWRHYLVQMVVPLAIASGVLAARASRGTREAALATLGLAGAAAVVAAFAVPTTTPGGTIGTAVATAERPGDTLTTLYGDPRVNLASGLPSPYEYLWSLPVKVRDPRLSDLDAVLAGPRAPVWLVVLRGVPTWGLETERTSALVAARYSLVARCRDADIYLRAGLRRPRPACAAAGSLS